MRRMLRGRGVPVTLVGIAALVAAAAAGAYATSGGGTITVCVRHSDGGLYRARRCASRDGKLSWNLRGPKGRTGPKGAAGAAGAAGPAGPAGAAGAAGAAGVTSAWSGEVYPANATPQADGHVAKFVFSSSVAGFVDLSAHFGVRVHNALNTDCHVQNQLASSPSVPSASPGSAVSGYMDDWVNGNLPTENGGGTFLKLDESVSDVLPVVAGTNTFYLNGASNCAGAYWGPIAVTGLFVNSNPSATLTAP